MTGPVRRPPLLYVLVGAALLLLPVMATLQYRWIGQVSDAERERRARVLQHATTQVASDLDLELARAFVWLQVDGESLNADDWTSYNDRVQVWRAAAVSPTIVQDVLLVDRHPTLRLRRWDASHKTFVDTAWTSNLDAYRLRFEHELTEWDTHPPEEPLRPVDLLNERADAIVAPIAPMPHQGTDGRVMMFRPVFGYTMIRLDVPFIRDEFLPGLVERHFRQGASDEYRVAVVERAHPAHVVFASHDDNVPGLVARHDAAADLFGLRPDQGLIRAAAGSLRATLGQSGDRRRSLFISYFRGRPPGDRTAGESKALDSLLRWKLVARHRAGSLEAAVGGARTRNLLLSFGMLVLMAASVGVLGMTARRAERLARQQIEFVAAVSHELRTPVSVIGAAAENLADGLVTDPDRVKRYGTRMQTEARRLGATVERVLLYAGIEAGRAVRHLTPVELGSLVGDALAASHSAIADAGVTVEADVPAGTPPVLADATALRSCIANLIANAIKYGGPNPWVRISATTRLSGGRPEVQLAVADRGLGIPASDLPHIFEPFYRGSEAQSRQIHGNGLGLSIVKGIVEAHGGRVSVQSAAGSGSTFVLHLPVHEASQPSAVVSQLGATARRA